MTAKRTVGESAGSGGSPARARPSFWGRVKEHKVVQWTLAYAAAAYTLLHAVEMVSDALDWPHLIVRLVTILLFLGLPIVTTLAWYHGHRAQHRVSGPELAILTVLLVIAGSVLYPLVETAKVSGVEPLRLLRLGREPNNQSPTVDGDEVISQTSWACQLAADAVQAGYPTSSPARRPNSRPLAMGCFAP
jgi:hypothetical protein